MKPKPDTIERAVELIRLRAFTKYQGKWRIINDQLELSYYVEREYCDCPHWQFKNAHISDGQILCKHQWLIFAAPVALFIVEVRKAQTVEQLTGAVQGYQESVKLALPEYAAIANLEYEMAVVRIESTPEIQAEAIAESELKTETAKPKGKYQTRTVNKSGESITMIRQHQEPQFYGSIQIN
jgi:hypothetical protein